MITTEESANRHVGFKTKTRVKEKRAWTHLGIFLFEGDNLGQLVKDTGVRKCSVPTGQTGKVWTLSY